MSAFTINTTLEGNVVEDITLRQTGSGQDVANMRVAVTTRTTRNGKEYESTEFITCVLWNQLGVNAAASLSKGDRVIVTGDLRSRQYEDSEGVTRYVTEVSATNVGASLRWHVVAGIEKSKDALVKA
jgi:single-strand DNA-binding protein